MCLKKGYICQLFITLTIVITYPLINYLLVMKKPLLLLCLLFLLSACAASKKAAVNNDAVFKQHTSPVKIFGIGRYNPNQVILTLIDANNQYFVIEEPFREDLKVGAIYTP